MHIYLIHLVALLAGTLLGMPLDLLFWDGTYPNLRPPEGYGYSETAVLAWWLSVSIVLCLLCRWYDGVRSASSNRWLRYL